MPTLDLNFGDVGKLPDNGIYRVMIEKTKVKQNNAKDGYFINVQLKCIDMPNENFENHTVFGIVSLKESARWKLQEFLKAFTGDPWDQDGLSIEVNDANEVEFLHGLTALAECKQDTYKGKLSLKPDVWLLDDGETEIGAFAEESEDFDPEYEAADSGEEPF